jgi:hypothetical protein
VKPLVTGERMFRVKFRAALVGVLLALATAFALPSAAAAQSPGQGPGGPILVVAGDSYGSYYAEILRAEGLNEFAVGGLGHLNPATLSGYQVVVLGAAALDDAQASALNGWVNAGGNLIAMRPDPRLAGLLGLGADTGDLADGYVGVATGSGPGAGITGQTMQFHGTADRWTVADASTVATLYSSATAPTSSPAVTLRSVGGAGGQAAAFAYDLARSVVLTRQGNPSWVGEERDGISPLRSDDLFFGGGQPDWVNLDKVHLPQADEQQRLLANLITQMNLDRAPLPRFWYLPRGEKAAVVMTGDDHDKSDPGMRGTKAQFGMFEAASPAGCSLADWQCVRSTSYAYPSTAIMTNAEAAFFQGRGFEVALHLTTGCQNFTPASLQSDWSLQRASFAATWPALASPRSNRTHCVVWSDWASEAHAALAHGVRFDTNYYYWPGSWVQERPGLFTGSGFPMRFADGNGALIDVYQATTQLTDELGDSPDDWAHVSSHIQTLLNRALGPEGYYGVFTTNMHTDYANHTGANVIVSEALARGVPVVSAVQMLEWLDGRNNSSFQGVSYTGGSLQFTVSPAAGSRGLEGMVPLHATGGSLLGLTRDGVPVGTTLRTVKGIDYAVFDAAAGTYVATYPPAPGTGGGPGGTPGTGGGGPGTPGKGSGGSSGGANDNSAPHAKIKRRRITASRKGVVVVRVKCPADEIRCDMNLKLRLRGKTIARTKFTVAGSKTAKVHLKLRRPVRRKLAAAGSLRFSAVLKAHDAAGNHRTTTKHIRVLAPGWR